MKYIKDIKENMIRNEEQLYSYASKSKDAIHLSENINDNDIRNAYQKDVDKIIHALSYTRYIDKTQVYTNIPNDNISTRMTHVQFVSRASRTIARALGVNEDLCEAISLGHDIGHTPYGHVGEKILNDICRKNIKIGFAHNIQSVRVLMELEKNGEGLNLSLQVLDGIMCHNGELIQSKYMPREKSAEEFLKEYNECTINAENTKKLIPMTLEGCIVRVSDIIGYIGKDIEDAVRLGKISLKEIPEKIVNTLGNSNSEIMNTIILDVIENSFKKGYISMSSTVYEALEDLKKFNYTNIYEKAINDRTYKLLETKFKFLYSTYLKALENNEYYNDIFGIYLKNMSEEYILNNKKERIVIDFISGMTDNFFEKQYIKYSKI